MTDDHFAERMRGVLRGLGDRALPSATFDEISLPAVRFAAPNARRMRLAIVGVAAVCLAAGALVWRSVESPSPVVSAPASDRWVAIPTYLPDGLALLGTPAAVGTDATTFELIYQSGSGRLTVRSSRSPASAAGPRSEELSWGSTVNPIEIDGTLAFEWSSPAGGSVVLHAPGVMPLDQRRIAESMWYVPSEWIPDLVRESGFASPAGASRGRDVWQPSGDQYDGSEVAVRGSLQAGFEAAYGPGLSFGLAIADACFVQSDVDRQFYALVVDWSDDSPIDWMAVATAKTERLTVTLPSGEIHQLNTSAHPGLPNVRFASFRSAPFDSESVGSTCAETMP